MATGFWEFISQIFTKSKEDEELERFIDRLSARKRDLWFCQSSDEIDEQIAAIRGYWPNLTQEEKRKFLEECTKTIERQEGSCLFTKATDDDLRNASKFIAESRLFQIATRYLGLTSQEILGRDAFHVLKLWRDAMPDKGSKQVCMRRSQLEYMKR